MMVLPRGRSALISLWSAVLVLGAVVSPAAAQALPGAGEDLFSTKVAEGTGGFVGPLAEGDQFGYAIAPIGDLDGDGFDDVVAGARLDDDGGTDRGALWVLFLDFDASVLSSTKLSSTSGGLSSFVTLDDGDRFGHAVASFEPGTIVVGAPGDDDGGINAGAVWFVDLDTDGTVLGASKIGPSSGGFTGTLDAVDEFGSAITSPGDIDGDTFPDLSVGAQFDDDGGANRGAVWNLLLDGSRTVIAEAKISQVAGFTALLGSFGGSVTAIGDLDGNGVTELAVGARFAAGPEAAGWTYIVFLDVDGSALSATIITEGFNGFLGNLNSGDEFGRSVVAVGDVDGDGVPDLAVGAAGDDSGAPNAGAVWVLFLNANGTVKAWNKISALLGGFTGTLGRTDQFGASLAAIGDSDGDGIVDLAVGAPGDDDGDAFDQGAIWFLFLSGAPEQPPFVPLVSALDGRPGRPTVVLPPPGADDGGGDDAIDDPIVVVPSIGSDFLNTSAAEAAGDSIDFTAADTFGTGQFPHMVARIHLQLGKGPSDGPPPPLPDSLVIANKGSDSFTLLKALPVGSDPPFEPPVEFFMSFDTEPVAIGVGLIDTDLNEDVILVGAMGVTVFYGDGFGDFPSETFTAVLSSTPFVSLLTDLGLGDVDGDGSLDVVTASGAIGFPGTEEGFATVLLNDGFGALSVFGTFATGDALASILIGNFDAGTDLDALVVTHDVDSDPGVGVLPTGLIDLYLGDGAGGFTLSGIFAGVTVPDADGIHPLYGSAGDINGDTLLDAVFTSSENIAYPVGTFEDEQPPVVLTILVNDGAGGFTVSTQGTAYVGKAVTPLLEDIAPTGGDGDLDCILVFFADVLAGQGIALGDDSVNTYIALLVGNGDGTFSDPSPNQFLTGSEPGNGAVGDVDGGGADGGAGPDIVVPNVADNSVTVVLGDSAAGSLGEITIAAVDDFIPGVGLWVGGPREVLLGQLDALSDNDLDMVVYNSWEETAFGSDDNASLTVYRGSWMDAPLDPSNRTYVPLARGGAVQLGDVTADGATDIVLTQHIGGAGADEVLVIPVSGEGVIGAAVPAPAIPGGLALTGGLVVADVNGDFLVDVVTTANEPSFAGHVLVFLNDGAGNLLPPLDMPADANWRGIVSMGAGDFDLDGALDLALGAKSGQLYVLAGGLDRFFLPDGSFAKAAVNAAATAVGGGALRVVDVNGDGEPDIVSNNGNAAGESNQAFVRTLLNIGNFAFQPDTVGGIASVGIGGALRPAIADMNDDGAVDIVVSHGAAGVVSILLNGLSTFEEFGSGKQGSGGITPRLSGRGYTTPGGVSTTSITNGLGGTLALFQVGLGRNTVHPYLAISTVFAEALFSLLGPAGVPGAGFADLVGVVPEDPALLGVEIVAQVFLGDPGAPAPPAPAGISGTNGLAFTIVQ